MITQFEMLVMTHFLGDWILQPEQMAYKKLKDWKMRMFHCAIYTFLIGIILKNIYAIAIVFISHFLMDTLSFKKGLIKLFRGGWRSEEWYAIVFDQIIHMFVLFCIVAFIKF